MFQMVSIFTALPHEMIQVWLGFFQMGWFNHQLASYVGENSANCWSHGLGAKSEAFDLGTVAQNQWDVFLWLWSLEMSQKKPSGWEESFCLTVNLNFVCLHGMTSIDWVCFILSLAVLLCFNDMCMSLNMNISIGILWTRPPSSGPSNPFVEDCSSYWNGFASCVTSEELFFSGINSNVVLFWGGWPCFSRNFLLTYVTSGVILGYGVDRSESWFLGFEITVGPLADLAEFWQLTELTTAARLC